MNNNYNIELLQGVTFVKEMTYYTNESQDTPVDLTGYTAKMEVRAKYGDPVLITLSTDDGSIVLGDALGTIVLSIDADDTLDLTDGIYDLVLISPSNESTRLIQGNFCVSKQVTDISV